MRKAKVNIMPDRLQLSAEVLRALAHPLRLQILEFIDQHAKINVNKIYNTLGLEQSITSQHLRILRRGPPRRHCLVPGRLPGSIRSTRF